jgi:serine/threonine protein phosphatase PrpC
MSMLFLKKHLPPSSSVNGGCQWVFIFPVFRMDLSRDWVIAKPDVTYTTLTPEDQFLVLASDGLWDAIKR